MDSMDCGSTCLRIIAKFYGKNLNASILRENCFTNKCGVSLLNISDEAERLGFRTFGVKITWENFKENALLPCIVHWNRQHFIVIYRISNKYIYASDPGFGLIKINIDEFLKYWLTASNKSKEKCGIALLMEPTPKFFQIESKENDKINVKHLLRYLFPYKFYFFQLFLGILVGSFLNLLFPFISQGIIDFGIGNSDINFVVVMLVAQMILIIGQFGNDLIRNWLMLHVTSRICISFISDFLSKLMRLPIAFFDSKKVGDMLQRIDDYSRIQDFMTNSLLSISMAVVTFVIYSCVMGFYSVSILVIFFIGSFFYVLWFILFFNKRKKLDFLRFQVASRNQSNLVQLVTGMQDIKLNNCENLKRNEWEHLQVKLFNIRQKSLSLGQIQGIGGVFISQIKDILISFLAAKFVLDGKITLGMMMAVQYIIGQLNGPIIQMISFVQAGQDAKISLERLNEIYRQEDEDSACEKKIKELVENVSIRLVNINFQYGGPHSTKVLENINLYIPAKKVTAIVGYSGSGKTTLLKIILGFYHPISGEIYVGNHMLNQYEKSLWRANCGVVMQDGYIFSDSIANNIGISEAHPNLDKVRRAAKIANIDDFIEELPLKYNTIIGMEGNGLSSGQKQRILIARAVFKDAKYLFFDEATNSLDASNEHIILDNLKSFFKGRTVVVAAHRLSTVKNADQIIVLNHGKIVEIGTHNELVENKGHYFQLVKNQLELGE